MRIVQAAVPEFQVTMSEQLPQLFAWLLRHIVGQRLPRRHLRSHPRVVKRKMSDFPLKPTCSFRAAVMLI